MFQIVSISYINISQGSIATHLKYSGIFNIPLLQIFY